VSFFSDLLGPDRLCFDVGANIGEETEILLGAGARVVAFEPQPDCMRELKARCGHHRKLRAVQSVLGAEPGEATMYIRERNTKSSLYQDWEGEVQRSMRVPVATLDQAIGEFGLPYFCKIDVEGWEYEVLRGLAQPIPLLQLEYHFREREIRTMLACMDYLADLGRISVNITPAQTLSFAFQEWLPPDAFLELFPRDFRRREGYSAYGDIWIRTIV
jgi:FkbM family methyltransferase